MDYNRILNLLAMVLVIAGALNWGSIAAFEMDLVNTALPDPQLQRYTKFLVGLAGIFVAYKTAMTYMK
jgi:uncharacterized membrane protein YuzA (DUF378 family)